MGRTLRFDEQEVRELKKALEKWSRRSKKEVTLNGLLNGWAEFVRQVERGYTFSIYDYINDLSVRDVLEDVLLSIRDSARTKVRAVLMPLDERFEKATRKIEKPLVPADDSRRWWFRVPLVLAGELKEDLEALGLA